MPERRHALGHNALAMLLIVSTELYVAAGGSKSQTMTPAEMARIGNQANAHFNAGRHSKALEILDDAFQKSPTTFSSDMHSNKGAYLSAMGRHEEAHAACEAAVKKTPTDDWFVQNLALTKYKLAEVQGAMARGTPQVVKLLNDAVALYDRALKLNPSNGEIWRLKGTALNLRIGHVSPGNFSGTVPARRTARKFWEEAASLGVGQNAWEYNDKNRGKPRIKGGGARAPFWTRQSLLALRGSAANPTGLGALLKVLEDNWLALRKEALTLLRNPDKFSDLDYIAVSDPVDDRNRKSQWHQFYLQRVAGTQLSKTPGPRGNVQPCWKDAPVACKLLAPFLKYDGNFYTKGCKNKKCEGSPLLPLLRGRQVEGNGLLVEPFHAFYSSVTGAAHVTPHCGPTDSTIRLQLPLQIPKGDYRFLVKGETRHWKEGKVLTFEESFEHEVWSQPAPGQEDVVRILFIVDVLHPELLSKQWK